MIENFQSGLIWKTIRGAATSWKGFVAQAFEAAGWRMGISKLTVGIFLSEGGGAANLLGQRNDLQCLVDGIVISPVVVCV